MKSFYSRFALATILLVLLASCETSTVSTSDVISKKSEKALATRIQVEEQVSSEHANLLSDSAAFFVIALDEDVPAGINGLLQERLELKISEMSYFSKTLNGDEQQKVLLADPSLNILKDEYLDTLTNVSVSIKDISIQMGEKLGVDNLFILQIDDWPCSNCQTLSSVRMKLRIVDNKSGVVVWTAFAELSDSERIAKLNDEDLAIEVSNALINDFSLTFQRKWHRVRSERLSELSKS